MPQAGQPDKFGVFGAFFTSLRVARNVTDDDDLPLEVHNDGTSSYTVENTHGVIESVERCITADHVKALVSLGDALKQGFSTAELEKCIHSTKHNVKILQCGTTGRCRLNVLKFVPARLGSTCTLTSERRSVSMDDEEWTLLMQITNENLNDTDCVVIQ